LLQDLNLAGMAGASQRSGYIARVYDGFVGVEERSGGCGDALHGSGPNSEDLLRRTAFLQILPFGWRTGDLDRAAAAVIYAGVGFAFKFLNECGILAEAF
jgi:hypothetical protein